MSATAKSDTADNEASKIEYIVYEKVSESIFAKRANSTGLYSMQT